MLSINQLEYTRKIDGLIYENLNTELNKYINYNINWYGKIKTVQTSHW